MQRHFFSRGAYRSLPVENWGIEQLRGKLSWLLKQHLKKELPDLKSELDHMHSETSRELSLLGKKRDTINEQRQFVMGIATDFSELLRSAVDGHYESDFFGKIDVALPVDTEQNARRLRAAIQYLNTLFADQMHRHGHKYVIRKGMNVEGSRHSNENGLSNNNYQAFDGKVMDRKEAIDWVLAIHRRSRGRELPGNFNPMLINHVFWEQSSKWENIALTHVDKVSNVCQSIVKQVLSHVTSDELNERLLGLCIEDSLSEVTSNAKEELERLVTDKNHHPITYNDYFIANIQDTRVERFQQLLVAEEKSSYYEERHNENENFQSINKDFLSKVIRQSMENNMDKFSAEDALDSEEAYYKDELKYFVAAVTKQVIERHLVKPLASTVLSPTVVAGFNDDEVRYIAAEPEEVIRNRAFLEGRMNMLKEGQETFRRAMGGYA